MNRIIFILILILAALFFAKNVNAQSCDTQCKTQGFDSGTCESGGTSSGNVNGIWCYYSHLSSQFLSRLVDGKITHVFVSAAHWGDGYSGQVLVPELSDAKINNFISQVKGANPNIKVFAWVWPNLGITGPGYAPPDLSTSSSWQTEILDRNF